MKWAFAYLRQCLSGTSELLLGFPLKGYPEIVEDKYGGEFSNPSRYRSYIYIKIL